MANLSDKLGGLTFVPRPQSPAPSGLIELFGSSTAPTGWLECDGSAVSRTTYSDLFASIGIVYGVGDGSTTFNLPDGGPSQDTEWEAYTPSSTPGLGTITSRLQWRRIGENVEIIGDITNGTIGGSLVQIELPNSYTVDLKNSTSTIAIGHFQNDGSATFQNQLLLGTHGDTFFAYGGWQNDAARNTLTEVTGTQSVLTGARTSIELTVPVAEFAGQGIKIIKAFPDTAGVAASLVEATSDDLGTVKKNRWQKVTMVAAVTSNFADLSTSPSNSGFKFANLVVGVQYEIKVAATIVITGSSVSERLRISAVHDSVDILDISLRADKQPDQVANTTGNSAIFTATTTTVTFATATVLGTVSLSAGTSATLIERNDLEPETSAFTS